LEEQQLSIGFDVSEDNHDGKTPSKQKSGLFKRMFGRRETLEESVGPEEFEDARILEKDFPIAEQAEEISAAPSPPEQKRSWWARLRAGLSRSSSSIGEGLAAIFTKRKLDAAMLEDLEDVLIRADLGVAAAARIAQAIGHGRYDKDIGTSEVKEILAAEIERTLAPYALPLEIDAGRKPFVILVVGVNGSGKTTTIGKLAAKLLGNGHSVLLAAGDTFRAAAIEQLRIWGQRLGCPVIAREQGSDASALAFDAIKEAGARGASVMLMDTAGRLQNRAELMAELEKIIRVMKKVDADAPHAVLLVLDATVGQNALSQVEIFERVAGVTGLVMTKLDGTARGGILVAIAEKFELPVHFIGVGESVNDLESFEARDFARAIAGLEN
jgi:fused signal recognition particle receptor